MATDPVTIEGIFRGKKFLFKTKAGVFCKDKVDRGSQLLIEKMEIQPNDFILDLGCGYGPIGIVAATLAYKGRVILADSNLRAIHLSEENIALNKIKNAQVLLSDGWEAIGTHHFSAILSNPPASSGIDIFEEFAKGAFTHLRPEGKLYFVTQSRLKNAVKRVFEKIFGNYKIVDRNSKYTVSLAIKK